MCTSRTQVPSNAGRFWAGLWFPTSIDADKDGICETGWTGTADFDTTVLKSIQSRLYLTMNQVTPHKKNHSHMMDGLSIHSQN